MSVDVSLIVIINKNDIYKGFLKDLSEQKDISYQTIPVLNYNNEFISARKAYNSVKDIVKGRYCVFLHPDIRFLNDFSLRDIFEQVEKVDDFGVVGIAGSKVDHENKPEIITSIVHGSDQHNLGDRSVEGVEEVQTVDECLFVVKTEYFQTHPFPEIDGWHLYAVEYCLDAILDGKKNYVIPADIWHMSDGASLDEKYMEQLERLIKKYKDYFDVICTTVKAWPTKGLTVLIYRRYYWIKQRIKRIVVRR